jgi:AMP phosphorylase
MRLARHQLETHAAWNKMKEIIAAQWGDPNIDSESLKLGKYTYDVVAEKDWTITWMDLHDVNAVCRRLGCPIIDEAWMYIYKKLWSTVKKDEVIARLYAQDEINLNAGIKAIKEKNPFQIWSSLFSKEGSKGEKVLKTLKKVANKIKGKKNKDTKKQG